MFAASIKGMCFYSPTTTDGAFITPETATYEKIEMHSLLQQQSDTIAKRWIWYKTNKSSASYTNNFEVLVNNLILCPLKKKKKIDIWVEKLLLTGILKEVVAYIHLLGRWI